MHHNKLCTIYLVRHGESEWNTQGLMQGSTSGIPLTKTGIRQARELAGRYKTIKFAAIFSSDLLRARQTAQVVAFRKKLAVMTTKALRERSFGELEGKTLAEYERELRQTLDQFHALSDTEKFKFTFPRKIEGVGTTVSRVITWLREVSIAYPGKNILAVAHGGVLRLLLIHLGYATYSQLPPFSIDNTAWVILESDGVEFKILNTAGVHKHV